MRYLNPRTPHEPRRATGSAVPISPSRTPLVAIRSTGTQPPVFCFHPSGGSVSAYLRLQRLLGDEQPVFGIQSRALHDARREHSSIASMAVDYATVVQSVGPDLPYRLLGWSM